MMKKNYVLLFIFVSLVSKAWGYDTTTITRNNWKEVSYRTGIKEISGKRVSFLHKYRDKDILGALAPKGSSHWLLHVSNDSYYESEGYTYYDSTTTTFTTPGTLYLIGVDEGKSAEWGSGIHVYSSGPKEKENVTTILNMDTNVNMDFTSHKKYHGDYYPIYSVVDIYAQGSKGEITKPITYMNFNKKVNSKVLLQTEYSPTMKNANNYNIFSMQTNDGGEAHLKFEGDVNIESVSKTDDLRFYTFFLQNTKENRFKTVSTRNEVDKENGGSSIEIRNNLRSVMKGNTTTTLNFMYNYNSGGGIKVHSAADKIFYSKIENDSLVKKSRSLNLQSSTKDGGLSQFHFDGNTFFRTSLNSEGGIWGIFFNASNKGENRLFLQGKKNLIETIGKNIVYSIKAVAGTGGKNLFNIQNTEIKTNSGFIAKGVDFEESNKGEQIMNLKNSKIVTEGKYAYGIHIYNKEKKAGDGETKINFDSTHLIHSKSTSNSYGIKIQKDLENTLGKTLITSTENSDITILSESEGNSYGISQSQKNKNNTVSTFQGNVDIELKGKNTFGVFVNSSLKEEGAQNRITFSKSLKIKGPQENNSLYSQGKNSEIRVLGKGDITIIGNVLALEEGKLNSNFLNEKSFLRGAVRQDDSSNIQLQFANSSIWDMTDDSNITELTMNSEGKIQFTREKDATLMVKNLKGNSGIFYMQGDVKTGKTDLLSLENESEGKHYIRFENNPGAQSTGKEILKIVASSENNPELFHATFSLKNPGEKIWIPVEQGGYLYMLGKAKDSETVNIEDNNKNNWYLFPVKEKENTTPGAQAGILVANSLYQLGLIELQTLVQRMGEIHFNVGNQKKFNLWLRHLNGEYTGVLDESLSHYKNRYSGIQLGMDWQKENKNWLSYNGFLLGSVDSKMFFDRFSGKATVDGKQMGLYSTWLNKSNNHYYDVMLKYSHYKTNFDIVNYSDEKVVSNNPNVNSYLLSFETGRRIYKDGKNDLGWYIQPEGQLIYQWREKYTTRTSQGLEIKTRDFNSLVGRIGFRLGRDDSNQGKTLNPYLKAMYEKEFLGKETYSLNNSIIKKDNKEGWFTYGLGITHENKETGREIYLELQKSDKRRIKQNWQVNFGLRYSF